MRQRRAFARASWVPTLALACAGACGGGGGAKAPTYTPVSATTDGTLSTLQLGDLKMVVDESRGGRITEFSLFGTNTLVTRDQNGTYGSTYWPSPQSSWCAAGGACWPPPAALDSGTYAADPINASNNISLTSGPTPLDTVAGSALVLNKTFVPLPESGAINVVYQLSNSSTSATVSLAPWQISRVATNGLTFFGQGAGPVTYTSDSDPTFAVTEGAGDLWYASAPVTHDSKAFADGAGWLAQATPDRLLSLVSWTDVMPAQIAPGEAEIEVFTNGDYVEIEAQGALTTLAPGQGLTWAVQWKLRPIPAGASVAAGSADLAALATTTLAE